MVLANLLFVTGESYGLASTISRWSSVDTLLLALVASIQSCGHRLYMYCIIEIPRAISGNNGRLHTFTHRVQEQKATNMRFSPSYAAGVTLSNDIHNSISFFSKVVPFPRAGHSKKH